MRRFLSVCSSRDRASSRAFWFTLHLCFHKDGVLSKDAVIVCFASFFAKSLFPLHHLFDLKICVCVCVCVPVISRNDVVLSHRLGFRLLLQLALDGADVVL